MQYTTLPETESGTELLSVIIPVYNTGEYLGRCIDSIKAQSYRNLEIIIVDDGSDSETAAICDLIASSDPCIRVYHKENGGAGTARNFGIDRAMGTFITFVDSDDYIDDVNTYQQCIYQINQTDADIVQFPYQKVYPTFRENAITPDKEATYHGQREIISNYMASYDYEWGGTITTSPCDKVYRKSSIGNYRFRNMFMEDSFFITHILQNIKSITVIKRGLYAYFSREGSTINSSFSLKKQLDLNSCRKVAYEALVRHTDDSLNQCRLFVRYIKGLAIAIASSGDNRDKIIKDYMMPAPTHIKGSLQDKVHLYGVRMLGQKNYIQLLANISRILRKTK